MAAVGSLIDIFDRSNGMKIAKLAEFRKAVTALTEAYWHGPKVKEKKPTYSPKAKHIARVIKEQEFGCYAYRVARLVEAVIGESLPLRQPSAGCFPPLGTLMILTGNPNMHDYPYEGGDLELAAVLKSRATYAFNDDGSEGNHLPRDIKCYRAPTEEEQKAFWKHFERTNRAEKINSFLPVTDILKAAKALKEPPEKI
jgi:hypothetical protein